MRIQRGQHHFIWCTKKLDMRLFFIFLSFCIFLRVVFVSEFCSFLFLIVTDARFSFRVVSSNKTLFMSHQTEKHNFSIVSQLTKNNITHHCRPDFWLGHAENKFLCGKDSYKVKLHMRVCTVECAYWLPVLRRPLSIDAMLTILLDLGIYLHAAIYVLRHVA